MVVGVRRAALGLLAFVGSVALRPVALMQRLSGGGAGGGLGGGNGGEGGGGNGGGGNWGSNGGGSSSGGPEPIFGIASARADEEEEEEDFEEEEDTMVEEGDEKFLCEGVKAVNLVAGPGIPTQAELFEGLHCQAGAMVSRKQLSEDLTTLLSCAPIPPPLHLRDETI